MNFITLVGIIAGLLTTISFLPQVIKTWKTKKTQDLSLSTFVLQDMAGILWVTYGIVIKELPLILWNAISAVLVLIIVIFKLRYK